LKLTAEFISRFLFNYVMRTFNSLFLAFFCLLSVQAQELCGTHKILKERLSDESFRQTFENTRTILQNQLMERRSQGLTRGTIYKIPVVFHVLHNGGEENISKEQIFNALEILNRDYRKQNADTINVVEEFKDIVADIEIEFVLATKAPNGTCFGGITRTQSGLSFSDDGWSQVQAVIDGNDVFNGEWPGNQYLNFFICGEIGFGAAGYTYFPGSIGSSMFNGIWVLHNYVGSIGTSDEGRSRVLTHEIGHWLDLPHTWGYTNDPGLQSNCDSDDDIEDTPNTVGASWCNLSQANCGVLANVENYMDYSYCSRMFTEGQKERMRTALNSFIDGRNNLSTVQNIQQTGADNNFYLCQAKFSQDLLTICLGEQIQFTDASFNKAVSWQWSFEGGVPATSNEQNPLVTYNTSGNYLVKLIVSDGLISDTLVKNNTVTVLNNGFSLPFYEDFESITSLNGSSSWITDNPQQNEAFKLTNTAAYSGNTSVYLNNFFESGNSTDELISSPIDLSVVDTMVTLSFRYAYKKKPGFNNEKLQIYTSIDCGKTWSLRRTLSGLLFTQNESSDNYIPSSDEEWYLTHVTNILESNWTSNFRFKFKFSGQGGNNFFLDDINIYEGPPSTSVFSQNGLNEKNISKFMVYPNPNNGRFKVRLTTEFSEETTVQLVNNLGQIIYNQTFKSVNDANEFDVWNELMNAGIYTVRVIQKESVLQQKLLIK
jgi:PKD repeat protein